MKAVQGSKGSTPSKATRHDNPRRAWRDVLRRRRTRRSSWTLRAIVEPGEVDGGYIAHCVDLPGCISYGDTESEAFENLYEAIGGVLSVMLEDHLRETPSVTRLEKPATGEERKVPLRVAIGI